MHYYNNSTSDIKLNDFGLTTIEKWLGYFKMNITDKLRHLFETNNIAFKEVEHAPASTCYASAKARDEQVAIGGKTILFKDKKGFRLFVLSAAKQVDSNRVRKILKSQQLRFATENELKKLCEVDKGALPPFGRDFYPFDLYLDESILKNKKIAFNAGVLTTSFVLKTEDYLTLINPVICSFAKDSVFD